MPDLNFYDKVILLATAGIDFLIIWYFVQKLTGKRRD
ncbi:MAG: hypothetical protein JWP06_143 [Candidatus Saccharibacteria bacterium]|jgi:hypothetical protein|nr:hypothetical protein [Candidatus Saccharibacteria bacterium]